MTLSLLLESRRLIKRTNVVGLERHREVLDAIELLKISSTGNGRSNRGLGQEPRECNGAHRHMSFTRDRFQNRENLVAALILVGHHALGARAVDLGTAAELTGEESARERVVRQ